MAQKGISTQTRDLAESIWSDCQVLMEMVGDDGWDGDITVDGVHFDFGSNYCSISAVGGEVTPELIEEGDEEEE